MGLLSLAIACTMWVLLAMFVPSAITRYICVAAIVILVIVFIYTTRKGLP